MDQIDEVVDQVWAMGLGFLHLWYKVTVLLQKQTPSFTYELIVVDDGSQDRTSEVVIFQMVSEMSHKSEC